MKREDDDMGHDESNDDGSQGKHGAIEIEGYLDRDSTWHPKSSSASDTDQSGQGNRGDHGFLTLPWQKISLALTW